MSEGIEAPKRFLSLHWKLLITLTLLAITTIAALAWHNYQHASQYFSEQSTARHQQIQFSLEDILTTEQRALSKLAHTLVLTQKSNLTLSGLNGSLEALWPTLHEQWQLTGMALVDRQLQVSGQQGQLGNTEPLIPWLNNLKQTIGNTLLCQKQCMHLVAAPLLSKQKFLGYLLLGAPLELTGNRFFKQTNLPLSIVQLTPSPYEKPDIEEWQAQFFSFETTPQPLLRPLLAELALNYSLHQATQADRQLNFGGNRWSVPLLTSELAANQTLYFATAYNLDKQQQDLSLYIKRQITILASCIIIGLLLLWWISWRNVSRLNTLTSTFPMLGQRLFQEAREKIDGIRKSAFFRDEIDVLDDATTTLSYQLESLEKAVNTRTREMERLSLLDSLTGLANRHLFLYELQNELQRLKPGSQYLCVIMLDLDNFKRINDSLGHQQGDFLLSHIAKRLKQALSQLGLVARLGGDEFAILIPNIRQQAKAELICKKILEFVRKPITVNKRELVTSCSIGLVTTQQNTAEDDLIKHAELAMYRAKSLGGNNYQIFQRNMATEASETLSLEGEIRRAFEEQEYTLYLQPKVDMEGHIQGFESLIRWDHPERGILPPNEFIPAMESLGMIEAMDNFVLEASCRQLKVLEKLYQDVTIAVNISSTHFTDRNFISYLKSCLDRYPIDPSRLELEITETLLMENMSIGLEVIEQIKELGVRIAIDDFGTGYSSLSYLKKLPVDTLKIDREFIKDIPDSESDMQISSVIIFLAKQLNFKVVAEGVETSEQLVFLKANQCDLAQGFYFSKPIPAHQALLLLESERLHQ
ncbi:hypothetical protein R50073_34720 [Maricurvus nonylphenolicus]|uniref:bifunctional diguanylate cyclase/phosphodiesterase n=1 Tax=Maricurvus nonylphenolicus TaxID=1008307 RepID=UPI0036F4052A